MEFAKTNTFRIIVIIKMVAVVIAFLVYSKSIYFGDVISSAADNLKNEAAPLEQTNDDKSSVEQKSEATNSQEKDAAKQDSKRRSFLDDLLDLPKIDPSTAKKDEVGRYLALAEQKQRQIEDRTRLIQEKEANLVRLEKSIEQKLAALQEERKFFAQTIQAFLAQKSFSHLPHPVTDYKKL